MRDTIYRTGVFSPDRRHVVMRITPEFIFELCKRRGKRTFEVTMNALPDDARLVGVQFDVLSGAFEICVASETFAKNADGVMPPELDPVVWTEYLEDAPEPPRTAQEPQAAPKTPQADSGATRLSRRSLASGGFAGAPDTRPKLDCTELEEVEMSEQEARTRLFGNGSAILSDYLMGVARSCPDCQMGLPCNHAKTLDRALDEYAEACRKSALAAVPCYMGEFESEWNPQIAAYTNNPCPACKVRLTLREPIDV